ncbi:hypothetical protein, partial [Petrachloros mirabilis]
VGAIGVTPRSVNHKGNVFSAMQAVDLVVDKAHRTAGPAILLQKSIIEYCKDRGTDFLYGFPLKSAELIHRRLGYISTGVLSRWVKIIRSGHKLKHIYPTLPAISAISQTVDFALKVASKESWHKPNARYDLKTCDYLDAGIDGLWKRTAHLRNGAIVGERSIEYLDWRFRAPTSMSPHAVCVTGSGGHVHAYAIYEENNNVVQIRDLLYEDIESLVELIARMTKEWRDSEKASISINCVGDASIARVLTQFGFIKRPSETVVVIRWLRSIQTVEEMMRGGAWYLTDADMDI